MEARYSVLKASIAVRVGQLPRRRVGCEAVRDDGAIVNDTPRAVERRRDENKSRKPALMFNTVRSSLNAIPANNLMSAIGTKQT